MHTNGQPLSSWNVTSMGTLVKKRITMICVLVDDVPQERLEFSPDYKPIATKCGSRTPM